MQHSSVLKMPGKCRTFKWADMWRRWSDNQNGPLCLILHRWRANTLSKEYFWRHELIPSTLFHFPALLDHILSCKVLAYVYFCVRACACVCRPLPCCYFKCYKNLQRKTMGWVTSMSTPINLCFFTSILPPSSFHFVETCRENHILGNIDPFRKQFKVLHRLWGQWWSVAS